MASRRSMTATSAAAGAVLFALCFVPTASATPAAAASAASAAPASPAGTAGNGAAAAQQAQAPAGLADTGAVDTTPYVVGGAGFLAVGAALLLAARRRALLAQDPEAGATA